MRLKKEHREVSMQSNIMLDNSIKKRKSGLFQTMDKYKYYYILLVLPIAYFIIFKYIPILGNVIAFRKYEPGKFVYGTQWVGLKYFEMFLYDPYFWKAFTNTIILSVTNLVFNFPIPIIFALLINELHGKYAKKIVQSISYLPRFLSTVIVVGMLKELLSPSTGIVNLVLANLFHIEPIFFVNDAAWFRPLYILSDTWQMMGWNAIIYFAALTNIDPQLYESARIDGAGRWKQTLYITLPGIKPTMLILLILSVGSILNLGFEKILLLRTPLNSMTADIIDTYVYRIGLVNNNYSYAAAIGLFGGLISFSLVAISNYLSNKLTDSGLY